MANGQRCPACNSPDITGRGFDIGSGDEAQERYCYDCSHFEERVRSAGGVSWYADDPVPHRMHAATGVERTLVDEIRAAPDDDGPRSVYADYLIERGDPLGTFMALQLARYRRRDPVVSVEEQALLDAHWPAWIGPPAIELGATRVAFEHGLWSAFDGSRMKWMRPASLVDPAWATVRELVVGESLVAQLAELLRGPLRRSLRSITLRDPAALAIVAAHGLGIHELKLAFDVSRDPPDLADVRTIPVLHTLSVECLAELAPRWIERADAARFVNLVLVASAWHADYLAAAFAAASKTTVVRHLAFDHGTHALHAKHDGGERFAITHVALRDADLIASVDKLLAPVRRFVDPAGVKLTLPSITPARAELAQRFGHKLVASPTSFAAEPTGPGQPART